MNARRILTTLAAILITAVQTLILAVDTAAATQVALPSIATLVHTSAGSSNV